MTVVVTGASGHLGGALVRALLDAGRAVRAVSLRDDDALAGLDCERVRADVRDGAQMRAAVDGAEALFHLAAVISISGDPRGVVRATNVEGARNVMQAALDAGVRRVVHYSSIHAFDLRGQGPVDETSPRPSTATRHPAYDRSKAAGEEAVRDAIARGLDAVIINPTGVIGPLDFKPSRMGRFFLKLARRRLPALIQGGFDWVDVRDVAAAALAAEQRGRTGENYIIGGGWASVGEVAALAEAATGVRPPRLSTAMGLARVGAPFVEAWGRLRGREPIYTTESLHALRASRQISSDKAARELGHAPRALSESVRDLYACFAERGVLTSPAAGGAR